MGILGRINDIIRFNINEFVSKAEDPEKMLQQAILDMEEHVRDARKKVLDTIAAEKTFEKRRLVALERAGHWERRAGLALQNADEDLARQALLRKAEYDQRAESLEGQIRVQREYVGALKQSLASLEDQLQEARARKDALIKRARTARDRAKTAMSIAEDKINSGLTPSSSSDTFDRMEEKIVELEARVEAFLEGACVGLPDSEDTLLDERFSGIDGDQGVEKALAALRAQIEPREK